MADFIAVLKKTIDNLSENTPEMRSKVYDKARATIAKRLADRIPPLAPSVVDQQKRTLEDAISSVERGYAKSVPAADPLAELEHIFSSIDRNRNQPTHSRQPAPPTVVPAPPKPDPFKPEPPKPAAPTPARAEPSWQSTPKAEPAPQSPVKTEPAWQSTARTEPSWQAAPKAEPAWQKAPPPPMPSPREDDVGVAGMDATDTNDGSDVFANDEQPAADTFQRLRPQPQRKRGYGGLIAAVIALLVLAGGGYGVWLNKSAFGSLFGLGGSGNKTVSTEPLVKPAPAKPATETAAAPAPAPAAAGESADTTKFTQRLTPEGKETDPGPAGGQATIGEGESVAALTSRPQAAPATAPAATPPAAAAQTPAAPAAGTTPAAPATGAANPTPPAAGTTPPTADAATTPPAAGATPPAAATTPPAAGTTPPAAATAEATVPVGQKAIFYEERTSTQQGTAEPGSIVWSLVQESPGGDLPPEPAIRAEATIPGKNIQLRMTIRRNADQTLPASHIIEMIFLTPKDFDGGGVDGLLRIAMKSSEQDAGSPLIGLPAKIGDGFFLVALNDTKADEDANLTLLRGQSWIDVPVVYKTGRRALLTMEKGIPGEKVFDEALKAWATKTSG